METVNNNQSEHLQQTLAYLEGISSDALKNQSSEELDANNLWLDEISKHLSHRQEYWTIERCTEEARKYRGSWRLSSPIAFAKADKNEWFPEIGNRIYAADLNIHGGIDTLNQFYDMWFNIAANATENLMAEVTTELSNWEDNTPLIIAYLKDAFGGLIPLSSLDDIVAWAALAQLQIVKSDVAWAAKTFEQEKAFYDTLTVHYRNALSSEYK